MELGNRNVDVEIISERNKKKNRKAIRKFDGGISLLHKERVSTGVAIRTRRKCCKEHIIFLRTI